MSFILKKLLMTMYGSHIPSLGKEVLGEIFGAAAPPWIAARIFSCSSEAFLFFLSPFYAKVSCSFR